TGAELIEAAGGAFLAGTIARFVHVRDAVVLDDPDSEAERGVDRPVPDGVAAGEVVVDRDQVDAAAGERVQVDGGDGRERFALASAHLGDASFVESDAAHELDVVRALAYFPGGHLAGHGEGLGQEVVETFAFGQGGPEL